MSPARSDGVAKRGAIETASPWDAISPGARVARKCRSSGLPLVNSVTRSPRRTSSPAIAVMLACIAPEMSVPMA